MKYSPISNGDWDVAQRLIHDSSFDCEPEFLDAVLDALAVTDTPVGLVLELLRRSLGSSCEDSLLPDWPIQAYAIASYAVRADHDAVERACATFPSAGVVGLRFALGLAGHPIDREVVLSVYQHMGKGVASHGGLMTVLHDDNFVQEYCIDQVEKGEPIVCALGYEAEWQTVCREIMLADPSLPFHRVSPFLGDVPTAQFVRECLARDCRWRDVARVLASRDDTSEGIVAAFASVAHTDKASDLALLCAAALKKDVPEQLAKRIGYSTMDTSRDALFEAFETHLRSQSDARLRSIVHEDPAHRLLVHRFHFVESVVADLLAQPELNLVGLRHLPTSALPLLCQALKRTDPGSMWLARLWAIPAIVSRTPGEFSSEERAAWQLFTSKWAEHIKRERMYVDRLPEGLADCLRRLPTPDSESWVRELAQSRWMQVHMLVRLFEFFDPSMQHMLAVRVSRSKDDLAVGALRRAVLAQQDPVEYALRFLTGTQEGAVLTFFERRVFTHPKHKRLFQERLAQS